MRRGQRLRIPNDYGYGARVWERGYYFPGVLASIYVWHYYGYGRHGVDEKMITKA